MNFVSKLAFSVVAATAAGQASAACYWQWQGTSSHFVCDPEQGSTLPVQPSQPQGATSAYVSNRTGYHVYLKAICNGSTGWMDYQLQPNASQTYSCPAGTQLNVSFKSRWLAGCSEATTTTALHTGSFKFMPTSCGMALLPN